MASHFKNTDEPDQSRSSDDVVGLNDLSTIGQEFEDDEDYFDNGSSQESPDEVVGIYHKHQSRKSRGESNRRARRGRSHSRRHHHRRHRHHHHHHHHRRVWPKVVAAILVLLVIVVGVEGFFLYKSVKNVREESRIAVDAATEYLSAAKAGDRDKLVESAQAVSDSSHRLKEDLAGTEWTVASYVPVVGSDVTSVRTIADVLVDVADEGLIPLSEGTEIVGLSELMSDGAVNMDALKNLCNAAQKMQPLIDRSAASVESLPKAHIQQVASVVETAREALVGANEALTQVDPLLADLPTLLGENGQEKNYLILASNTAEVHASGGFVGAMGVLSAKDGVLTLGDFDTLLHLLPQNEVSAGATSEEINTFGARIDTHHGDHNITPDFPRVGEMYYNIWDYAQHQQLDGVISVDPIFLQSMLALTGGIDTSYGVTVDGTNAAQVVLNECYYWGDNEYTDAFFREVASSAFKKILSSLGDVDTLEFLQTIREGAHDGRCIAWVHDAEIEKRIQRAGFGWELSHDPANPLAGVYISDASGTKSAYYLSLDVEVGEPSINSNGSRTYPVVATIRHNMDRSLIPGLPDYLKSGNFVGKADSRSDAELGEEVSLVAPEGGSVQNVSVTYKDSTTPGPMPTWSEHTYQGLNVQFAYARIDAGEACEISFDVVTSPDAQSPLQVRTTPVVPHSVRGD